MFSFQIKRFCFWVQSKNESPIFPLEVENYSLFNLIRHATFSPVRPSSKQQKVIRVFKVN